MDNFTIIDPKSISYDSIKEDILNYVQNLPDFAKWKDFYESGAGMTQIELLSGLGTFLGFHAMGVRREAYLDSCKLYTSAVNICNIIGYPVQRVSAPRLRIKFRNPLNFYWERANPMFYLNNRSVCLLHSQTIPAGINELDFVVGDWHTTEYTSTSNDKFANSLILDNGIDANMFGDTIELFINGIRKNLINYADDMLPENVLLRTYNGGVLLIFGDGYLGYQLRVNDKIKFNYITTDGVIGLNSVIPDELVKNIEGTVLEVQITNPGYIADSLPKMAAVAPGYLTSKRRMVTGKDHIFILMNYSGSLISANYKKLTEECCTILLSYLFEDEHYASTYEKTSMLNFIDDYKMVGEKIVLVNPVKIGVELKIVCIIEERSGQTDIEDKIKEIIEKYTMKLGDTFHIGQITADISKIPGIYRVYLVRPVSDKVLEFDRYLKLVSLEVVVTANKDYVVEIDPSNNGYWRFRNDGLITGVEDNRLIDANAYFQQTLQVGNLITNKDLKISARVTEVVSDTVAKLDKNIFTTPEVTYEVYDVNV